MIYDSQYNKIHKSLKLIFLELGDGDLDKYFIKKGPTMSLYEFKCILIHVNALFEYSNVF